MTEFTDSNGRVWNMHLTHAKIDHLNDILNKGQDDKIDLLELTDDDGVFRIDMFPRLVRSPRRIAEIIAGAMKWEKDDEDENEALFDGLKGDGIEIAMSAFFDELSLFFPAGQRAVIRQIMKTYNRAEKKAGKVRAEILEKTIAESLEAIGSLEPAAN